MPRVIVTKWVQMMTEVEVESATDEADAIEQAKESLANDEYDWEEMTDRGAEYEAHMES